MPPTFNTPTSGPPRRDPPPRRNGFKALFAVVVPLVLVFACLAAITPACLPPVTCTPGAMSCDDAGVPTVCSNTGRGWTVSNPAVPCREVGGVCVVRDNVAACVRDLTGGAR